MHKISLVYSRSTVYQALWGWHFLLKNIQIMTLPSAQTWTGQSRVQLTHHSRHHTVCMRGGAGRKGGGGAQSNSWVDSWAITPKIILVCDMCKERTSTLIVFSMPNICPIYYSSKFSYFAFHYLSCGRFRFKSGNLEHPGDIIRNASVEVLPVSALVQAHKMPGLIYNFNAWLKSSDEISNLLLSIYLLCFIYSMLAVPFNNLRTLKLANSKPNYRSTLLNGHPCQNGKGAGCLIEVKTVEKLSLGLWLLAAW